MYMCAYLYVHMSMCARARACVCVCSLEDIWCPWECCPPYFRILSALKPTTAWGGWPVGCVCLHSAGMTRVYCHAQRMYMGSDDPTWDLMLSKSALYWLSYLFGLSTHIEIEQLSKYKQLMGSQLLTVEEELHIIKERKLESCFW